MKIERKRFFVYAFFGLATAAVLVMFIFSLLHLSRYPLCMAAKNLCIYEFLMDERP